MLPTKNAFDVLLSGQKRKRDSGSEILVVDSDDDVACVEESTAAASAASHGKPALAPIFRALGSAAAQGSKEIICVRHGHTNGYHIVDTGLSPAGQSAASSLLSSHPSLSSIHCVVVSPLTRALHTVACAWAGRIGGQGEGAAATASAALPIFITPLAAERVSTVGDLGRTVDVLLSLPSLARLQGDIGRQVPHGHWWRAGGQGKELEASVTGTGASSVSTTSSWASTVPASFRFPPGERAEGMAAFRQRVGQLRAYLRALPQSRIALVAHANTIMELTGSKCRLDYCQAQVYRL